MTPGMAHAGNDLIFRGGWGGASWQTWNKVLTNQNYSNYVLPLSGGSLSGALTVNGGSNSITVQHDVGSDGNWHGRIISKNATADRAVFLGNYASIAGVFAHNNALNAWNDLYINTTDGSGGGTVRMPASVLVNGNQVIHTGNPQSTTEWYHSGRDFVNGTLITTSIDYSQVNGDPFVLQIRGNSYGSQMPFDTQWQGYIYSSTIINTGGYAVGANFQITAMNVGGYLCFWFARQAYWQGFNVHVYTAYGPRAINKVTAITDVANPNGSKQVTFTPTQVLRSDNYSSYALSLGGGSLSTNAYLFCLWNLYCGK